jgi:hypothetical protein
MTASLFFRRFFFLLGPIALVAAGCGGTSTNPNNGVFTVSPSGATITTAGTQQYTATLNGTSQPAAVNWSLSGGDPNAGPGYISATGLYYPPAFTSSSSVTVYIQAQAQDGNSSVARVSAYVIPAVSMTPEVLAITPGQVTPLYAQIAQLGGGSVNWSLVQTPGGSAAPSGYGSISSSQCYSFSNYLSYCQANYNAPSTLPTPGSTPIYAQATLKNTTTDYGTTHILLNSQINVNPLTNQAAQTGNDALGTSGGDANDIAGNYCCSGTLGSLIAIQGTQYILGANHSMAITDTGSIGDTIIQPGLIDVSCNPYAANAVASLSYFPLLSQTSTNVDLALAQASSGAINPAGDILEIGPVNAGQPTNAPPSATPLDVTQPGIPLPTVVKSGRSTGLTCDPISAIAADVTVTYNTACDGSGFSFVKTFTNQVDVSGASFADSGDSGSLILDQTTAQPVGLLYAGNSTDTFANPIVDVISAMNTYAVAQYGSGATATFVGGPNYNIACVNYDTNQVNGSVTKTVSASDSEAAQTAIAANRKTIVVNGSGILDLAVGASEDAPGKAAIIVYTDESRSDVTVPQTIDGIRTLAIPTTASAVANGTAPTSTHPSIALNTLPRSVIDSAITVKNQFSKALRNDPAVFGVAVAKSIDNPNEAAILVYVDRTKTPQTIHTTLGGLRVRYVYEDTPRAFNWKRSAKPFAPHASCPLKASMPASSKTELVLPKPTLDLR